MVLLLQSVAAVVGVCKHFLLMLREKEEGEEINANTILYWKQLQHYMYMYM
jgi:hypothetical protein